MARAKQERDEQMRLKQQAGKAVRPHQHELEIRSRPPAPP